MIRTILKPLSFLPALLLMYMIFSFSSQTGDVSSQLSYQVSYKMVEAADYVFDAGLEDWQIGEWANKINFITRKLAHMAEYFALAVAVSFPLYVYGLHGILLMLVAGIICVGFACGDEYHQAFVAGRGPSVKDVCIDSVGVFFGIIFVRIIGWTGRKTIFKPKEKVKKTKVKKIRGKKKQYADETYYEDDYRQQPYPRQPYGQDGYQKPPYGQDGRYQQPYGPEGGQQAPPYGRQQPYEQEGYRQPSYGQDRGYQEPPYGQGGYPQQPYGRDDRRQNTPHGQDGRRQNAPHGQDGRYQEAPYDREGYRQSPYGQDNRYQQSPYGQDSGYQTPPYRQDGRYQESPYEQDGRYQEPPHGQDGYRGQPDGYPSEDEWFDEEDLDIDSAPDASYDADWQDPARANDWGMDEQPPAQDIRPQQRQPMPEQQPGRKPDPQPKKKKKAKKEKDWFFDM